MKRADHRAEMDLVGELDFVEQEDDAPVLCFSRLTDLNEEVGQVARDGALVRGPQIDLESKPLRPREPDRPQVPERLADLASDALAQAQACQSFLPVPDEFPGRSTLSGVSSW